MLAQTTHSDKADLASAAAAYYANDDMVNEYLAFHFPDHDTLATLLPDVVLPALRDRYPYGVQQLWQRYATLNTKAASALDVGCACGRMSFALAQDHARAVGLDYSANLTRAAQSVAGTGIATYQLPCEGSIARDVRIEVPYTPEVRKRTSFTIGDAHALPFGSSSFATVIALNLIDRVRDPQQVLAELVRVCAQKGLVIVGSPYTWLEQFTPRHNWLASNAEPTGVIRGAQRVSTLLAPSCELVYSCDLPFCIHHHARSAQLGLAHVQCFRRR